MKLKQLLNYVSINRNIWFKIYFGCKGKKHFVYFVIFTINRAIRKLAKFWYEWFDNANNWLVI